MSAIHASLDNKSVKNNIRNQLKTVKKYDISAMEIIGELGVGLKDVYSITRQTLCELSIKIDKKTKMEDVEVDIRRKISSYINNGKIDVDILFRITARDNEITIQAKRYNEKNNEQ